MTVQEHEVPIIDDCPQAPCHIYISPTPYVFATAAMQRICPRTFVEDRKGDMSCPRDRVRVGASFDPFHEWRVPGVSGIIDRLDYFYRTGFKDLPGVEGDPLVRYGYLETKFLRACQEAREKGQPYAMLGSASVWDTVLQISEELEQGSAGQSHARAKP